jgi:hypothetical protein
MVRKRLQILICGHPNSLELLVSVELRSHAATFAPGTQVDVPVTRSNSCV